MSWYLFFCLGSFMTLVFSYQLQFSVLANVMLALSGLLTAVGVARLVAAILQKRSGSGPSLVKGAMEMNTDRVLEHERQRTKQFLHSHDKNSGFTQVLANGVVSPSLEVSPVASTRQSVQQDTPISVAESINDVAENDLGPWDQFYKQHVILREEDLRNMFGQENLGDRFEPLEHGVAFALLRQQYLGFSELEPRRKILMAHATSCMLRPFKGYETVKDAEKSLQDSMNTITRIVEIVERFDQVEPTCAKVKFRGYSCLDDLSPNASPSGKNDARSTATALEIVEKFTDFLTPVSGGQTVDLLGGLQYLVAKLSQDELKELETLCKSEIESNCLRWGLGHQDVTNLFILIISKEALEDQLLAIVILALSGKLPIVLVKRQGTNVHDSQQALEASMSIVRGNIERMMAGQVCFAADCDHYMNSMCTKTDSLEIDVELHHPLRWLDCEGVFTQIDKVMKELENINSTGGKAQSQIEMEQKLRSLTIGWFLTNTDSEPGFNNAISNCAPSLTPKLLQIWSYKNSYTNLQMVGLFFKELMSTVSGFDWSADFPNLIGWVQEAPELYLGTTGSNVQPGQSEELSGTVASRVQRHVSTYLLPDVFESVVVELKGKETFMKEMKEISGLGGQNAYLDDSTKGLIRRVIKNELKARELDLSGVHDLVEDENFLTLLLRSILPSKKQGCNEPDGSNDDSNDKENRNNTTENDSGRSEGISI